jgi:predicted ATP-grasp superfamily ATP-dependent carboligase
MSEFFNVIHSKDYFDKQGIESSQIIIVVMSKNWIAEELRQQELAYAISLKKLIAVAVFDEVDPTPYIKDARVLVMRTFDRKKMTENKALAQALVNDFMEEVQEKMAAWEFAKGGTI